MQISIGSQMHILLPMENSTYFRLYADFLKIDTHRHITEIARINRKGYLKDSLLIAY